MDADTVSDIKLLNGNIAVSSTGDIAIVTDMDNLKQRIINKFRTNEDSYLFGEFGSVTKNLIDETGGNLIDLIEQSVTATLMNEADIASIDNVKATQSDDTFYVDISVTAVTGETLSFTTQL